MNNLLIKTSGGLAVLLCGFVAVSCGDDSNVQATAASASSSSSSSGGSGGGSGGAAPDAGPEATIGAAANPANVCSAILTFTIPGATSATVTATGANKDKLTTPTVTLDASGNGTIVVLGLAAATSYTFAATAMISGKAATTPDASFETSALPPELAALVITTKAVTGALPTTGYYLVGVPVDASVAVDGKGVIRWYRQFDGFTEEVKMQTDGTMTSFVGATMGFQPFAGQYTRYTPQGEHLAAYAALSPDPTEMNAPVYTDNHDFVITKDTAGAEHFHMIGYEMRPVDPTMPDVLGAWHEIIRQDATGKVEFQWKTWDRFTEADSTEPIPLPGVYDVDHMNALSLDPNDGNYVASMRDLDAVVKVDAKTGDLIWQIGGIQSTFTVVNDPLNGFFGQHNAHVIDNGDLLLYDNGLQHSPMESRAAEYKLDTTAKTATLVWEYRHDPPIFTPIIGSVYRLSSGNTLVGFADVGTFDEVTPDGKVVWEGQVDVGTIPAVGYRMTPLPSLYEYVKP